MPNGDVHRETNWRGHDCSLLLLVAGTVALMVLFLDSAHEVNVELAKKIDSTGRTRMLTRKVSFAICAAVDLCWHG